MILNVILVFTFISVSKLCRGEGKILSATFVVLTSAVDFMINGDGGRKYLLYMKSVIKPQIKLDLCKIMKKLNKKCNKISL